MGFKLPAGKKPPKKDSATKDKKPDASKSGGPSEPNTPSQYFMDTEATKKACDKELKLIRKNCTPSPESQKKKGLGAKLGEITDGLDSVGKKTAGYVRDKSTGPWGGNAWMDENCKGLWTTPLNDNKNFPSDLKEQLNKFADKLDLGFLDKASALMNAVDDVAAVAMEFVTPEVVEGIASDFATKAAIKLGIGMVGAETGVIPFLMGIWTAADAVKTAQNLAALAGDKGQAALDAFNSIYNIGDEAKKILDQIEKEPAKAYTNAMTLMAKLDPCVRARKCMLVKYSNTEGNPTKAVAQAKHGNGCCPGQTGHHILPDSMVKDAGCDGYNKGEAPVMCLEGTSNNAGWGSHGEAHQKLKNKMSDYRRDRSLANQSPNTISYDDAANNGIDAVRDAAARQCDKNCLRAQLDEYYKCKDKTLKPADGTGPMIKMPEPTKSDKTR